MSGVPWNKGQSKLSHPSVMKISKTLAGREHSNFYYWEQANPRFYKKFTKDANYAEFYGFLLGDGCIEKLARTEKVTISCDLKYPGIIERVRKLMTQIVGKEATVRYRKNCNCVDVYIYQKHLSERFGFPAGKKSSHQLLIPDWIGADKCYMSHCLKGLFESDGDHTVSVKNYTDVIKFTNISTSLLDDVYELIIQLGFHPQRRNKDVRLARKKEVEQFITLINYSKN